MKGSRFGNFVVQEATEPVGEPLPIPESSLPEQVKPVTQGPIPAAPDREERRPFSTRLKPSLKRVLDTYMTELKLAGWPVSQEGVLEELVNALEEDAELRAQVTHRLTK